MVFGNGVKNIQAAAYNGARMVDSQHDKVETNNNVNLKKKSKIGQLIFIGFTLVLQIVLQMQIL